MIQSKQDYYFYLNEDKEALYIEKKRPSIFDDVRKFERLLRKCEYYKNCKKGVLSKLYYYFFLRYKYHKMSIKLNFQVPLNTCDSGLALVHPGIIINGKSKIGKNCRIYSNVVIGSVNGECPTIGDNVYIGAGAKLIGGITIGSNIKIGANAVVNKSFQESNITLVGIPAKSKLDCR